MAFTKTPSADTYSQEDVSVTREWTSRQDDQSAEKDVSYLNCFVEVVQKRATGDKRKFVIKRSGVSTYYTPPVSGTIRGSFYWVDNKSILFSIDNDLYQYHTETNTLDTMSNVFSTSSGPVGFCTFLYDTGVVHIIATDGTTLLTVTTTSTATPVVDADLPATWVPTPVFLDGYLFIVEANTGNIYNSDLNDPTAWTGDFITAEMEGDRIVALNKINNYIVAFGSETVEYFWDAGIETGSPLQRNATPVKINKYVTGLVQNGSTLFYIGAGVGNQLDVYVLRDFQNDPIGTPTVTRYLSTLSSSFVSQYFCGIVSFLGHTFYTINSGPKTLAYDVETKEWIQLAYQDTDEFNIRNSISVQTSSTVNSVFNIDGTSVFYQFDDGEFQDNGTNFTMKFVTDLEDFGTLNRKNMSKLVIVSDRPDSTSTASIYWTDDDYQTYSDAVEVELNQDLPSITRLGSFRQRAFKFEYTDNYPMRVQKFQVNINKGRN